MTSLSDLAKQLHMSRQAIDARMKKIPGFKAKYTKIQKHRLYISKAGVQKLDYSRQDSLSKNFEPKKLTHKNLVPKQQLREDIAKQRKLIYHLNKSIAGLVYTNGNQQKTIASQQQTINKQSADLNGRIMKINQLSSKLHHDSESRLYGPKSTFWGRLKLAFHPKRK